MCSSDPIGSGKNREKVGPKKITKSEKLYKKIEVGENFRSGIKNYAWRKIFYIGKILNKSRP